MPVRASTAVRALSVVTSVLVGLLLAGQACAHVLAALSARGLLLVTGCLDIDAGLGWWGTHLAMVRVSPDCPEGTFAPGGDPAAMAAVVISVALPALVAHALGLLVGVGALGAVRAWMRSVRHLALRGLLRTVPVGAAPVVVGPRRATAPDAAAWRPHELRLALVPVRRGPPLALAA